jgi:hypothetical protein
MTLLRLGTILLFIGASLAATPAWADVPPSDTSDESDGGSDTADDEKDGRCASVGTMGSLGGLGLGMAIIFGLRRKD